MGSISDYLETKLMDHVFGNGEYSKPATVYLGLSTADPTDDASGLAEPVANNYEREAVTFGAAATRAIANSGAVTFNQASGAWGTLTHWALFDALTAGNMMAHGSLSASKGVVTGNTPSVAIGEVEVSFVAGTSADGDGISNYLAEALLDFAFRNQVFAQPDIYLGLCTADIVDSDTGATITEVSGSNYARADTMSTSSSGWENASTGAVENVAAIEFPTPSGSWGTVTSLALVDAAAVGNLLFYDNTLVAQEPGADDTVEFPIGDIDISMS